MRYLPSMFLAACMLALLVMPRPPVGANETRGLLGCSDCYRDRAALVSGLTNAVTMCARDKQDLAEQRAIDALSAAGYRCHWEADDALDRTARRLECSDGTK